MQEQPIQDMKDFSLYVLPHSIDSLMFLFFLFSLIQQDQQDAI
jgi:hypothetical protein